jgi:maltooligosyltrehalose synthase
MLEHVEDGRAKLHAVRSILHARRKHPQLFAVGDYQPLETAGKSANHLFAFARRGGGEAMLAVAPRLTAGLLEDPAAAPVGEKVWSDTTIRLPDTLFGREWKSVFTREHVAADSNSSRELSAASLLHQFPVALLISTDGST